MNKFDGNGDGIMDFQEFIALMRDEQPKVREV